MLFIDEVVPISEAHSLVTFLDKRGTKYILKTYANAVQRFVRGRHLGPSAYAIPHSLAAPQKYGVGLRFSDPQAF